MSDTTTKRGRRATVHPAPPHTLLELERSRIVGAAREDMDLLIGDALALVPQALVHAESPHWAPVRSVRAPNTKFNVALAAPRVLAAPAVWERELRCAAVVLDGTNRLAVTEDAENAFAAIAAGIELAQALWIRRGKAERHRLTNQAHRERKEKALELARSVARDVMGTGPLDAKCGNWVVVANHVHAVVVRRLSGGLEYRAWGPRGSVDWRETSSESAIGIWAQLHRPSAYRVFAHVWELVQ